MTAESYTTDESIVEEAVSRFGLHRIHVIRMGSPVDLGWWITEKVLAVDGKVNTYYQYEEEEVGVHHLRLYWTIEDELETNLLYKELRSMDKRLAEVDDGE